MTLQDFRKKLDEAPLDVEFSQTMKVIEAHYEYTPCDFKNGLGDEALVNHAGSNEGSCKIFAFAQHQRLSEIQTLHCFGKYYTQDVLENPTGSDHSNIRTFIKHGWSGIKFLGEPLIARN